MLKIGLIGCGFMGSMHANCYNAIPDVKVTAVADLRRDKLEAAAAITGAEMFEDADALLAGADVDIIDICLPTFLHTEYALKAMDKVKYLFIEKPVALTAEEGDALLEKAKSTGCRVQIGQVIRFWDEYIRLAEIIRDLPYGKVVHASFKRISPRPNWGWNLWLTNPVLSGGANHDLHVHDTDFVLSVFGEPLEYKSVRNTLDEQNSFICTVMKYPDFAVAVEGTWGLPECYPFSAGFRVAFEKATVEYAGGKLVMYDAEGAHDVVIEKKELSGTDSGGNISDLGAYYNELKYFTDCAKANSPIEKATLAHGVRSLRFLLKEYGSCL